MNLNMPLRFFYATASYDPDEGTDIIWEPFKAEIGEREIEIFWAEWKGGYGTQMLSAQAIGVEEMATIRMPYQPDLCRLLRAVKVLIGKNADGSVIDKNGIPMPGNANAYMIFGGVDDILEEHQLMEFKVRRFENK